ncbi:hypothetical protein Tco_0633213 [Tanacetum coccineum]
MFYADDAVFMGQWSTKNIDTIIYVLKCFHRASGLSINLSKSKLLGVVVSEDRVVQAANRIGCGVLKNSFCLFSSKDGGKYVSIKSWDVDNDKMVDHIKAFALEVKKLSMWLLYVTGDHELVYRRAPKRSGTRSDMDLTTYVKGFVLGVHALIGVIGSLMVRVSLSR